jgi:hypothetical protein
MSGYLNGKVQELGDLMNKLEVYPISPHEMSKKLHRYGNNDNYLPRLYAHVTQSYVQSIIKTDAAVRMVKTIFRKKLQENVGR